MGQPHPPTSAVATAVASILTCDLPGLPDERRESTVEFIRHRFSTLPHHMRLGVSLLDRVMNVVARAYGSERFARLSRTRLPVIAEYFRLVRSLGYAFVWETWPDTASDGTPK